MRTDTSMEEKREERREKSMLPSSNKLEENMCSLTLVFEDMAVLIRM
jgi:hypothetical protein